jgi:oxygen-dependent protoporphyrinogen oxidase
VTDTPQPLPDLVETARATRVIVVGGGVAGLVAALECAKVGLRVTVVESEGRLGGAVRAEDMAGLRVDVAADGYSTAGGHVQRLIEQLELDADVEPERGGAAWLAGAPGGAAPLPKETVLGIPANPWDPEVRRIIGMRGAWRAYLDRLRPPLTIGQETNLDALVRGRMGDLVVDRLVAPLTLGRHGLLPAEVDVDAAAPGLNAALTRAGSLSDAVGRLREARVASGYETLAGGMTSLVDALAERLRMLGATIITGSPVHALRRVEVDGRAGWEVRHSAPGAGADADAGAIEAHVVIVAASESVARGLLAPHVSGLAEEPESSRPMDVVTLVVDQPALDDPPHGTAVYAVPGTHRVRAVVLPSARWSSVASRLGAGRHVVRVIMEDDAALDHDDSVIATAVAEASALLGVPLDEGAVLDSRRDRYSAALPTSAAGFAARARSVRAAVRAAGGLVVTGAWMSGSGLAQVVPDAALQAERVRKTVLFGAAAAE